MRRGTKKIAACIAVAAFVLYIVVSILIMVETVQKYGWFRGWQYSRAYLFWTTDPKLAIAEIVALLAWASASVIAKS